MSADEIKAKSLQLAALYTAKADGETLQVKYDTGWVDQVENAGPGMDSDLSRWRVKPEPRRMWTTENQNHGATRNEQLVAEWKRQGITVTEWQEVLP